MPNDVYGYIYKITNLVTNKVYIGQTRRDPKIRKQEHFYGCHRAELKNDMSLFGKQAFTFEVIAQAHTRGELGLLEKHYISFYNSMDPQFGYNKCAGGLGPVDFKRSEEDKCLMSQQRKGSRWFHSADLTQRHLVQPIHLDEYINNPLWIPGYGPGRICSKRSEEFKKQQSLRFKGKSKSKEQVEKQAETIRKKGYHWYTNGLVDIQLCTNEKIPEGFHKGRQAVVTQDYRDKCSPKRN